MVRPTNDSDKINRSMKKRNFRQTALWRTFLWPACCLLGLLPLCSACEQDPVVAAFTGEVAAVQFSVAMADYGENVEITRSGARRIPNGARPLESVTIPLDDRMVMTADLLEETPASTRANYDAIVEGARFRVVAFHASNPPVSAEYTYQAGQLVVNGAPLPLTAGQPYDFAFYSYNSTATAPAAPDAAGAVDVTPYSGGTGYDLLHGTGATTSAGSGLVSTTLRHKFTRVRLSAQARSFQWAINDVYVSNISASLTPNYRCAMVAKTGVLSDYVATSAQGLDAPGEAGINSGNILTGDYRIVCTNGANPTQLSVNCRINSTTFSGLITSFKHALEAGKSYTLKINFKQKLRWAGSNIYWDGSKLTFAPENTPIGGNQEASYQGVYFKWGSLVGISPAGVNWDENTTTGTVRYVPTYNSASSHSWGTARGGTFQSIPCILVVDDYTTNANAFRSAADYNQGRGDICRYISHTNQNNPDFTGYRMPTTGELDLLGHDPYTWPLGGVSPDYWTRIGSTSNPNDWADVSASISDASGRTSIPSGANHSGSARFPASGYRYDGDVLYAGSEGFYWSSDVRRDGYLDTDFGVCLIINISSSAVDGWLARTETDALPVRCIRESE
jgi:hypothetical protein